MGNSPTEECQGDAFQRVEDSGLASVTDGADALGRETEPHLLASTVAQDGDLCSKLSSFDNLSPVEPEKNTGSDVSYAENDYEGAVLAGKEDASNSCSHVLQEVSTHDRDSEKTKDSGTSDSEIEDDEQSDEHSEHVSDHTAGHGSSIYKFTEPKLRSRDLNAMREKSDFELEYDMFDPLEVARQVAIEVEKQVVDCGEESFSSSDGEPSLSQHPHSPDSAGEIAFRAQEDSSKHVSIGDHPSEEASERMEKQTSSAGNLGNETSVTQDMECSQVTCIHRELLGDARRALHNFDLNQVFSDGMDQPENQIFTSSPVATSKGSAAPGFQISQLHVEVDKAHSAVESDNSSKPQRVCFDIDLNADSADENFADPMIGRQYPGASGHPYVESSVEMSQRISEELELDLNRVMDGVGPSDWDVERNIVHQRNAYHIQTPSSSSSSKLPSLKNIDLNNQPLFPSEPCDQPCYVNFPQKSESPSAKKADDSAISIFGAKVKTRKNDFVPCSFPLLNGQNPGTALDVDLARTVGFIGLGSFAAHASPTINGYTGHTPGTVLGLSAGIYGPTGPIPYLLDARGAPFMPQVLGTSPAFPPGYYQSPFIMNMPSFPGTNGVGPLQGSLNVNSGLILAGGNRDGSQVWTPGQVQPVDDPLALNLLPSTSSGAGTKRKEDPLYEPYPLKRHQPSWR